MVKVKYEIKLAGEWIKVKKARKLATGWLHYELSDGTVGLMRPGLWRLKE